MLRFQPDSLLEGLSRPLTLLDPSAYVYVEFLAPDFRFAALLLLTAAAAAIPRVRQSLSRQAWGALVCLWLAFFIWTFVIGNGRYFAAGLLLVGPLLVLLVRAMPWSTPMQILTLVAMLGLQGFLVMQTFQQEVWALAKWTHGPGLPLSADESLALRSEPAIFITISNISQSVLVPQFHPASRWVNLFGQVDLHPGMPEYERWRSLWEAPLPRYVVLQVLRGSGAVDEQPPHDEASMITATLARYSLRRSTQPCLVVRSHWEVVYGSAEKPPLYLAYWFCPIEDGPTDATPPPLNAAAMDAVAAVERLCPKYFPPGGGKPTVVGDMTLVHYRDTDMRLYVESTGGAYYRHMRSLNPTRLGDVEQFRMGRAQIDCESLQGGRYVFPWQRD